MEEMRKRGSWGTKDYLKNSEKWEKEDALRQQELAKKREGDGRGFVSEPVRTLYSELRGNNTVILNEAWAIHGEEAEELDMGFPFRDPHDSEYHHVNLENIEDDREIATSEDELIAKEQDEQGLTGLKEETRAVKAGVKLIKMLAFTPTKAMCHVVGIYLNERMDGVIKHYFANWRDSEIKVAVLEFCKKMREYKPEISQEARGRLYCQAQSENKAATERIMRDLSFLEISPSAQRKVVEKAQLEWQREKKIGPNNELGEVLYGDRFSRLLRAK